MKLRTLFKLLPLILLLPISSAYAHLYADVKFDFSKGWIQITPPIYSMDSSQITVGKSSGFGFNFGGFDSTDSSHVDQKRDTYLILSGVHSGDPDTLSFRLVQFLCVDDPDAIAAIVTAWRFETRKGHIQVQGQFLMSKEMVRTLGESLVCTTQYRQKMAAHNLSTLPAQSGPYTLSQTAKTVNITWDASYDNDPLTKESRETIEQIDEFIKKRH